MKRPIIGMLHDNNNADIAGIEAPPIVIKVRLGLSAEGESRKRKDRRDRACGKYSWEEITVWRCNAIARVKSLPLGAPSAPNPPLVQSRTYAWARTENTIKLGARNTLDAVLGLVVYTMTLNTHTHTHGCFLNTRGKCDSSHENKKEDSCERIPLLGFQNIPSERDS